MTKRMKVESMVINLIIVFMALAILWSCTCTRPYKVTFRDGSVEYYNLNYKPSQYDKYIQTSDGTYIGVIKIERADKE